MCITAEQLKNLVYIDKMFPCSESSFLTCENRARVVCANSATYKWHSCVLRSQVENLAHSNSASFTGFIMSSLTVLPCGLLGLCHSCFSFNGVNQEVTVKLMFVCCSKKTIHLTSKEVQICKIWKCMQRPPPFSRNNSSGSVKCHQRSDHTDRWSLHGASQGSKPWSFLLSLRCFRGIVPLDVRAEHGAAGIAAGSPSLDLYPAPLRQRCAPLQANRSVCVCAAGNRRGPALMEFSFLIHTGDLRAWMA